MLIIDDEPIIRKLLTKMMELEGYEVYGADSCAMGCREMTMREPDVVLCDVFLPDGNGLDIIGTLKKTRPDCEIVMLTAHGNIADGVQAIRSGAFDYIVKGDDNRKIIPIVSRAFDEVRKKKHTTKKPSECGFAAILGTSAVLSHAISLARKVAKTNVTVLLTGETGTGKELFAHAIHHESDRSERPFVAVNCSAFSRELLESELFGHRAGAFTGAMKDKKGLFEAADGGTMFLDEVGEMDVSLQAKLLRVLETGEFLKIGETQPTRVDVRIVSATNRDLKKEINNGNFRSDLFYRLSVFSIQLPPLRDRREDIPLLAESFVKSIADKMGKTIEGMDDAFINALKAAPWHGNIRELRNVIERSVIVSDGRLAYSDLPIDLQEHKGDVPEPSDMPPTMDLASVEKRHIARVLQHTAWNKTEAARILGIGLTTLYRKIDEYGIAK